MKNKYFGSMKKRVFDLSVAVPLFCVLVPLFILIYPLLLIYIGKPIIFKQKRLGKDKVPFTLYKIRTMRNGAEFLQKKLLKYNEAPEPMFKMSRDPRFTKLGRFFSKFGLDELPQLLNIIKGEMSFVGPRPLPIEEANKLDKSWNFRYSVLPGILSEWAISKDRHISLQRWKRLEKQTLQIDNTAKEMLLMFRSLNTLLVMPIVEKLKAS